MNKEPENYIGNITRLQSSTYRQGDWVQKRSGGKWRGKIVGWYRTSMTLEGYAVESVYEPGSVQIYPVTALIPWDGGY